MKIFGISDAWIYIYSKCANKEYGSCKYVPIKLFQKKSNYRLRGWIRRGPIGKRSACFLRCFHISQPLFSRRPGVVSDTFLRTSGFTSHTFRWLECICLRYAGPGLVKSTRPNAPRYVPIWEFPFRRHPKWQHPCVRSMAWAHLTIRRRCSKPCSLPI